MCHRACVCAVTAVAPDTLQNQDMLFLRSMCSYKSLKIGNCMAFCSGQRLEDDDLLEGLQSVKPNRGCSSPTHVASDVLSLPMISAH